MFFTGWQVGKDHRVKRSIILLVLFAIT